MFTSFKNWWIRPVKTKDRILAAVIGGIAGFWIGPLSRLLFGEQPVLISVLAVWAIGAIVVGVAFGLIFPKIITVLFFPFSLFGIGS